MQTNQPKMSYKGQHSHLTTPWTMEMFIKTCVALCVLVYRYNCNHKGLLITLWTLLSKTTSTYIGNNHTSNFSGPPEICQQKLRTATKNSLYVFVDLRNKGSPCSTTMWLHLSLEWNALYVNDILQISTLKMWVKPAMVEDADNKNPEEDEVGECRVWGQPQQYLAGRCTPSTAHIYYPN